MGLHKNIETPEALWKHFESYRTDTKSKPFKVKDWVGGGGKAVTRLKERPLTMEGFENYLSDKGIIEKLDDYLSNTDNRYSQFTAICSRIRREIRQDQVEGGMAGMYNPSITQRLNNLVEKIQEDGSKEITIKVKYERKDGNTQ